MFLCKRGTGDLGHAYGNKVKVNTRRIVNSSLLLKKKNNFYYSLPECEENRDIHSMYQIDFIGVIMFLFNYYFAILKLLMKIFLPVC